MTVSSIRRDYADTPSGQVHFRRVEGPTELIPVILLHRTPVDSACFENVLERLAGQRTAIALDTPGFGGSFRPDGSPSAADFGDWFLQAATALGIERFHLAAHHTGTHFSVEMARAAPDRIASLLLSGVLYLNAWEREHTRKQIGDALPIDEDGLYLTKAWTTMTGLYPEFDATLVHAETLGALASPRGRDQAFDAILGQDFQAVLDQVRCPVRILQAQDDPLDFCLERVRKARPEIPITRLGPAGMAAPERQPRGFAQGVLHFVSRVESASPSHFEKTPVMTDRQYHLVRTETGFDLHRETGPAPRPGPGEVLLKVHAVSLNRRDVMIRDLSYPAFADRFTPCSDAAGEIVAVGEGVSDVRVGDRVTSLFFQNWASGRITLPAVMSALGAGGPGVLSDHVVLAAQGVAPIPAGLSYEQAATLPCAAVTAWSGLVRDGGLKAADWVLIMGTGGVALFGLQIAVAMGARVAIISSSDDKLAVARAMGASVTVNYATTPDWEVAIKAATDGGVHHVLELGGSGTLARAQAAASIGGHLALIGGLDGFGGEVSATAMIMGCQRVSAVTVGSRADHLALAAFVEAHGIQPTIDSVFDLDAIEDAYARAAQGAFGKVVIRF